MSSSPVVATVARSALLLAILIVACEPPAEYADLVLTGGKVVTVDDASPEREALAVTGYTITAVGTNEDIAHYVGPATRVIELDGRLAIPGFIEGHGHYIGLGRAKMILDLTTATSWDDIVQMVGEAASQAEPGEWVTGRGWHQEKWTSTPEPNVDGVPLHHRAIGYEPRESGQPDARERPCLVRQRLRDGARRHRREHR